MFPIYNNVLTHIDDDLIKFTGTLQMFEWEKCKICRTVLWQNKTSDVRVTHYYLFNAKFTIVGITLYTEPGTINHSTTKETFVIETLED